MTVLLAILAGTSLGYALERGDFCFHSTLQGLFRKPKQLELFRAYILALLIATPAVNIMRGLGWIDPWIPPFAWQANVLGGLVFGIGMVVAATCITGLFYKLGHGMLGTLVGLATWVLGDIIVYLGPLSGFRAALTASSYTLKLDSLLGPTLWGRGILLGLGFATVIWLYRIPKETRQSRRKLWGWPLLGITVGLVVSLSWLLARAGGENYPFGTSFVPSGIYLNLSGNSPEGYTSWIPVTLVSLIPGALVAAIRSKTLWVRGETGKRFLQLGAGGFLMGAGAAFAGGCNLGHSLVGVPLLSVGSIVATLSMAVGVYIANSIVRRF